MEALKKLNDAELLALLRDGEHAAFAAIYERYFARSIIGPIAC